MKGIQAPTVCAAIARNLGADREQSRTRKPKMMEFPMGLIFMAFRAESGCCGVRWVIKYFLEKEVVARRVRKD